MGTEQTAKKIPEVRKVKQSGAGAGRRSGARILGAGAAAPTPRASGMIRGLTALEAEAEGLRVENISPTLLIPHPFNEPARSVVKPGDQYWDELLTSVRAHGVRIAAAAVTRKAFTTRWPDRLSPADKGEFVLVYGHRRRAAALATDQATIPVIVDDSLLEAPAGGLIDMYQENKERLDLSPLAEAEFLERIAEELGITSQAELGEYLGLSQPTVSRRMSLRLLCPALQQEVAAGRLSPTEGAQLGAKLPYGAVRPWQKERPGDSPLSEAEQNSEDRLADQLRVWDVLKSKDKPAVQTAVDRVKAERKSRAAAAERGIEIVDPREYFGDGPTAQAHRIYDDVVVDDPSEVVAAIDEFGALAFYERADADPDPVHDSADSGADDDFDNGKNAPAAPAGGQRQPAEKPAPAAPKTSKKPPADKGADGTDARRTEAMEARRTAAASLINSRPSQTRLLQVLADQYATGLAALTGPEALHLAQAWGYAPDVETDRAEARLSAAWAIALATYELLATSKASWGPEHRAYFDLLRERAKYEPTAWERAQLDTVTDDPQ